MDAINNMFNSSSKISDDDFGFGQIEFDNIVAKPLDVTKLQPGNYFERALTAGLVAIRTLGDLKRFVKKTFVSIDTGSSCSALIICSTADMKHAQHIFCSICRLEGVGEYDCCSIRPAERRLGRHVLSERQRQRQCGDWRRSGARLPARALRTGLRRQQRTKELRHSINSLLLFYFCLHFVSIFLFVVQSTLCDRCELARCIGRRLVCMISIRTRRCAMRSRS